MLLLDLDGTLIDSEPLHKVAELAAFAELGIPVKEEDLLGYTGLPMPEMLRRVHAKYGQEVTREQFLFHEQPILREFIRERMSVFPDAERFLERHADVPKCLCTSSLRWYVEAVFERFPHLERALAGVICEADIVNGKPHPEPFLLAASRLGIPAEQCVALEDSVNGVRSARSAGCRVIAVQRHPGLDLSDAHQVVQSLDEVGQL